uniref:Uncharacterized protein n=1 Tax=Anguilla anguilla TaxID=7936 RepID=A0A0E9TZE7_ANGAN
MPLQQLISDRVNNRSMEGRYFFLSCNLTLDLLWYACAVYTVCRMSCQ